MSATQNLVSQIPERFQVLDMVGRGTFGAVYVAKETATGKDYAIKVLNRQSTSKYVEDEVQNHSLLSHPHIIRFHEVIPTDYALCIVMEYANGGSVFNAVRQYGRLTEGLARWYFQQLILAVDYCHRRGVANRDIKLENMLIHNEEGLMHPLMKLCDFGYSKADFQSAAKSQVGTISYMAPEVVRAFGAAVYDAKAADVWSCGVVLYVMLYGVYPFDGRPEDQALPEARRMRKMLQRMESEDYLLDPAVAVSDECLNMLRSLLKPRPEQRFVVKEIMDHPWFNTRLPPQAKTMNDYYLRAAQARPRHVVGTA